MSSDLVAMRQIVDSDESVEIAVKLFRETKIWLYITAFIHTQLISMNAKHRLKRAAAKGTAAKRGVALWYVE